MNGFVIRKAESKDKDLITCTLGAVYAEHKFSPESTALCSDISNPDIFFQKEGEFWVVESNGAICGGIGFKSKNSEGVEIKTIFLSPGWRKLGIGRMLNEKAVEFAKNNNFSKIWIIIYKDFCNSIEKLKKIGYQEEEAPDNIKISSDSVYLSYKTKTS